MLLLCSKLFCYLLSLSLLAHFGQHHRLHVLHSALSVAMRWPARPHPSARRPPLHTPLLRASMRPRLPEPPRKIHPARQPPLRLRPQSRRPVQYTFSLSVKPSAPQRIFTNGSGRIFSPISSLVSPPLLQTESPLWSFFYDQDPTRGYPPFPVRHSTRQYSPLLSSRYPSC